LNGLEYGQSLLDRSLFPELFPGTPGPNFQVSDHSDGSLKERLAVLRRRTRIVSFRISEEEYQDLVNLCVMRQARSVSDFARFATFSQFEVNASKGKPETALREVYRRIGALDREIKRLAELLEPRRTEAAPRLNTAESSVTA
jgi:hypothetical protein